MPAGAQFRHGRLVRLDAAMGVVAGLEFPRNPTSLRRTFLAQPSGPSVEVIVFTLSLDVTDVSAERDRAAPDAGVRPELAVLEHLAQVPEDGGTTAFVFGARAVPVRIAGLTIHEHAFDPDLHPVRVDVEVTLEVLGDGGGKPATELRRRDDAWRGDLAARVPRPSSP